MHITRKEWICNTRNTRMIWRPKYYITCIIYSGIDWISRVNLVS